jgi:hypothetical protein
MSRSQVDKIYARDNKDNESDGDIKIDESDIPVIRKLPSQVGIKVNIG